MDWERYSPPSRLVFALSVFAIDVHNVINALRRLHEYYKEQAKARPAGPPRLTNAPGYPFSLASAAQSLPRLVAPSRPPLNADDPLIVQLGDAKAAAQTSRKRVLEAIKAGGAEPLNRATHGPTAIKPSLDLYQKVKDIGIGFIVPNLGANATPVLFSFEKTSDGDILTKELEAIKGYQRTLTATLDLYGEHPPADCSEPNASDPIQIAEAIARAIEKKPERRGRKTQCDPEADRELVEAWNRFRERGNADRSKAVFCKDRGITVDEFTKVQTRVRKKRARTK